MRQTQLSLSIMLALGCAAPALGQSEVPLFKVTVTGQPEGKRELLASGSDGAQLLSSQAGYAVAGAGGVSGLPVVNGLADDRLKIRIDGMEITSACANHMNAPLSYVDPKLAGAVELIAGLTPVSLGGDSIGGTIQVASPAPLFARPGEGTRKEGDLSLTGRSVNHAVATGLNATIASDSLSFGYSGAYSRAHSYEDARGRRILASQFESINQSLTLAGKTAQGQWTVRTGTSHVPYQGFPNQYMDMTDNQGRFANAAYVGELAGGTLDASAYWQRTRHEMGFFSPERSGNMPMLTDGRNLGYALTFARPVQGATWRVGHELHTFRLNDYWPPVDGSMMMGPRTYVNVKDGRRDRVALFGEVETRHGAQWTSLAGARVESVRMDAGQVQSYGDNMMNAPDTQAAAQFNAQSHTKRDTNVDLTASARYRAGPGLDLELGIGRKTRSPNLYERFAWGRSKMAMMMTNWFGDGNGYVGNLELRPEVAQILSLAADWHGAAWSVKFAPYYNRVRDYIDVDALGQFNPYNATRAKGAFLKFANHDATLYGANLTWTLPLAAGWKASGTASLTRGKRNDGGDLYRIMPPTAQVGLDHESGPWSHHFGWRLVGRKNRVDQRRYEPETGGFGTLDLRTSYRFASGMTLSAGITNALDKQYADPLGGVYLSGLKASRGTLEPMPAAGRSVDIGLSAHF